MKPVLVSGQIVGYIHFNGTLVKSSGYIAQLTLELLDSLDAIRTFHAIIKNPAVQEPKYLLRPGSKGSDRFFIQFDYDCKGIYVAKPRSFLNARCKWLAVVLTTATR